MGGDLQHTHLVKGLDYALLQKVRSEITHHEQIQETEMENLVDEKIAEKIEKVEQEKESDDMELKTILGKNIHRLITLQRSKTIERNEMFLPNRMAYLVELEDENAESDIPTTIIRSKAETHASEELNTLNTNDIVVNKLTQIFSYLRQGGKKKNKKRDKVFKIPEEPIAKPSTNSSSTSKSRSNKEEDSIYGDIGDYKPSRSKDYDRERERDRDRDRYRDRGERSDRRDRKHYDDEYGHSSKSSTSSSRKRGSYFDKSNEPEEPDQAMINIPAPPKLSTQLITKLHANEPDSYAECYPGLQEMDDAIIDSDDEVDYTKMDKGNKKGPIGRWDFDTPEEYSDYMSSKEALPKAAFQYGLKMSDGRKTKKSKTDIQKIDQEWQKIQKIITKRKGEGGDGEVDFKKAKN